MPTTYDRHNFHRHTYCVFQAASPGEIAGLALSYTSRSGSQYYFTQTGVYRRSNHWGRAANCKWRLEGAPAGPGTKLGFARWTDFLPDNDVDKLYFIDYDPIQQTVRYQHKAMLPENAQKALFTAPEVTKRLREIRQLLQTDGWARHFDPPIDTLRAQLIGQMAHEGKTLREAKSALFK